MSCKLTQSITGKKCEYALAGVAIAFLANYYPPVEGSAKVEGAIAYETDADGYISGIHLPTDEKFYRIEGAENSTSYADALLVNGNGGKYRQHQFNTVIEHDDLDTLKEGDALSLGRFIAVVVTRSGKIKVLGRTGGLTADAGGFDYASGAAEADATGWTTALKGPSTELAPLVKDITVITPIHTETITA